ncbi:hypothetical protein ACIO3O_25610 [Streptomyces sp. NPDC087440]|uniref:hypothetical protein n=1 Tax=Streptomyces sp. NPDC087440 TaxID=3365790 RepID=UPI0038297A3F
MKRNEPLTGPADQLAVITAAPDLSRPASLGERVVGVATLVGLYGGLVAALESDLPRPVGVLVFVAALVLLLRWNGHHDNAARRRPHTRLENGARLCAAALVGIPGISLVFGDGPDTFAAHLVAPAFPTLAAAVYLVLRWRK